MEGSDAFLPFLDPPMSFELILNRSRQFFRLEKFHYDCRWVLGLKFEFSLWISEIFIITQLISQNMLNHVIWKTSLNVHLFRTNNISGGIVSKPKHWIERKGWHVRYSTTVHKKCNSLPVFDSCKFTWGCNDWFTQRKEFYSSIITT